MALSLTHLIDQLETVARELPDSPAAKKIRDLIPQFRAEDASDFFAIIPGPQRPLVL